MQLVDVDLEVVGDRRDRVIAGSLIVGEYLGALDQEKANQVTSCAIKINNGF